MGSALARVRRSIITGLVFLAVGPLLGAKSLPSAARTQIIVLEGALEASLSRLASGSIMILHLTRCRGEVELRLTYL